MMGIDKIFESCDVYVLKKEKKIKYNKKEKTFQDKKHFIVV